jgi:hypothetical protein
MNGIKNYWLDQLYNEFMFFYIVKGKERRRIAINENWLIAVLKDFLDNGWQPTKMAYRGKFSRDIIWQEV